MELTEGADWETIEFPNGPMTPRMHVEWHGAEIVQWVDCLECGVEMYRSRHRVGADPSTAAVEAALAATRAPIAAAIDQHVSTHHMTSAN